MAKDDVVILICGATRPPDSYGHEIFDAQCADCGSGIVFSPDPEVPEDAIRVCWTCANKRMEVETPEVNITKQNMELMERLGYELRDMGNAN